ncbi:MAG: DUF3267 domain-containing protein [Sphaerochaetaceae bacterium]|nr:DUF3267 domain-containing protein [Sphaerochaetaceae bacterium]
MENYFRTLPEGYREVKVVDAKDKKTATLFTVFSLVFMFLAALPTVLSCNYEEVRRSISPLDFLVFLASYVCYIVLHELTHGAAYKALTHQKLTFGFTFTVAFCGVPDIYTSRKTALIALAAPFLTYSAILIPLTVYLHGVSMKLFFACGILFALHFGGCVGDLYMMKLLLFKYKDARTLIKDTGPKQTIYMHF